MLAGAHSSGSGDILRPIISGLTASTQPLRWQRQAIVRCCQTHTMSWASKSGALIYLVVLGGHWHFVDTAYELGCLEGPHDLVEAAIIAERSVSQSERAFLLLLRLCCYPRRRRIAAARYCDAVV